MPIKGLNLKNITVFDELEMKFSEGINVLLGENGLGKTHVMKLIYAACQASPKDVSFPQKTVKVFRPDDFEIRRLIKRDSRTVKQADVEVKSNKSVISMSFSKDTEKWHATVSGEAGWEKNMAGFRSVYIPAKEILSNAWNLESAVRMGNVEFDDTYLDLIAAAKVDLSNGESNPAREKYLEILQSINQGRVTVEQERFYLRADQKERMEFNLVAEGLRKVALLWQLIKNGTLNKDSVLFWDEPEANINPKYIPVIVDVLLELQREGVQIFVATHDYFLSKYIETKKQEKDHVSYFSFYRDAKRSGVLAEQASSFGELQHNAIMETFRELYRDEVRKAMN